MGHDLELKIDSDTNRRLSTLDADVARRINDLKVSVDEKVDTTAARLSSQVDSIGSRVSDVEPRVKAVELSATRANNALAELKTRVTLDSNELRSGVEQGMKEL